MLRPIPIYKLYGKTTGVEELVVRTIVEVAHPDIGLYSRIVGVPVTVISPTRPPNQKYLLLIVTLLPSLLKVEREGPDVHLSCRKS